MKRLLAIVLILALVVVGALLLAPMFISADQFRAPIAKAAQDATGRDLALNGDLSLRLFPTTRLTVTDVAFANAPGAGETNMAEMKELRVEVALLPLLSRTLKISQFVLVEPVIRLEVDRAGKPNWEFAAAAPKGEKAAPASGGAGGAEGVPFDTIELGDVRIENGAASYRNLQTGADYAADDIDLTLSLPSLSGPFEADGALTYKGERVTLKAALSSLRDFADRKATEVSLALDAPRVSVSFDGSAAGTPAGAALPLAGRGKASLDIASLRKLMAWIGTPMAGDTGFGPVKLAGDVEVGGSTAAFRNATLGFDDMKGSGDVLVTLGGARPKLSGAFSLDKLDVTPYAGGGAKAGGGGGGSGGAPAAGGGWSTAPIDLSALRAVDADVALKVGAIFFNEIKIGESELQLGLADGVLDADLSKLALYKGAGLAKLVVDAHGAVPAMSATFSLKGIEARPLLSDSIGFKRLEGLGNLDIAFTTRGRSQRDMIAGLDGAGSLFFENGAIYGLNLAQLVRSVASAVTELSLDRSEQKTDFAEMKGTFTLNKGVLANSDLQLLNPLLRVAGEGQSNLLERTVKYRVTPVAVSTLEGQGGKTDVTGLSVPILITGTWDKLKIGPDAADLGRKLLGGALGKSETEDGEKKSLEDRLKDSLLGGKKSEETAPEAEAPPAEGETKPAKAPTLKDLFGQ
ncbi:MAG: AsmA family protein [Alphaproteobacteria bacterium]|nr:AsmA family protein [Alphaproteobacteria bacterium]